MLPEQWKELPGNSIGIFGGTFDPIQQAHIAIAQHALESGLVMSVVFVPAKKNPFKKETPWVSDADRVAMLEAALRNIGNTHISLHELQNENPNSYTVDTVETAKHLAPYHRLSFIAGSDQLSSLYRWHRIHDLFEILDAFLIFPRKETIAELLDGQRGNFSQQELAKCISLELETTLQEVSATLIRTLAKDKKSLAALVSPPVAQYIQENKLYE